MKLKHAVPAILAVVFMLTSLAPATASAHEVNHSLAANPAATLSTIDAMNLQTMPDVVAGEVRGEGIWYINMLTGAIVGTSVLQAIYGAALCNSGGCSWLPWFLKPVYVY